jgi:hypothetical protein
MDLDFNGGLLGDGPLGRLIGHWGKTEPPLS